MCVYGKRGEMIYDSPPVDQRLVQSRQRADQYTGEAAGCRDYCFPSQAAWTLLAADSSAMTVTVLPLFSCLKISMKSALRSKCTAQRDKNV